MSQLAPVLTRLICTSTNATPHERLLNYERRTATGHAVPTFLSEPGPVLLRKFIRRSKTEPLVQEVELLEANPQYAHIRYPDGRESTVSARDLAPMGVNPVEDVAEQVIAEQVTAEQVVAEQAVAEQIVAEQVVAEQVDPEQGDPEQAAAEQVVADLPRRSRRQRKPPNRLDL